MMLPVLSSEYFVYHYMQKHAVVRVYRQSYHVSDESKITSIIFTAVYHIHGGQQCFACDGIQSTRTRAQVTSFESPPCLITKASLNFILEADLLLFYLHLLPVAKFFHLQILWVADIYHLMCIFAEEIKVDTLQVERIVGSAFL